MNRSDVDNACEIWERIAIPQELNIPPYVYRLYVDVILTAYAEKNALRKSVKVGITRNEVMKKHYEVYGRALNALVLRQQIIPMLIQAGLINEDPDLSDKRNKLICPQLPVNNGESSGGLDNEAAKSDFDSMTTDLPEEKLIGHQNNDLATVRNIFNGGEVLSKERI